MTNKSEKTTEKKEEPVVLLTQAAIDKLLAMQKREEKKGCGLRIDVVTGGCAGLSYDLRFQKNPYDNDIIFEKGGLKIFVNPESASFLKGVEINYVDTLKESGFTYKNPNAQSSCGCGTSFS